MIAVLSGGIVAETGKHSELISKRGVYYDLVQAQKGKEKGPDDSHELTKNNGAANVESIKSLAPTKTTSSNSTDDVITFLGVDFSYPSRPDEKIFDELELTVKEGETLAIVGPR